MTTISQPRRRPSFSDERRVVQFLQRVAERLHAFEQARSPGGQFKPGVSLDPRQIRAAYQNPKVIASAARTTRTATNGRMLLRRAVLAAIRSKS